MLGDFEPDLAHARCQLRGGLVLVFGQFRIAVQVLVQRIERWIDAIEARELGHRPGRLGMNRARKSEEG